MTHPWGHHLPVLLSYQWTPLDHLTHPWSLLPWTWLKERFLLVVEVTKYISSIILGFFYSPEDAKRSKAQV